MSAFLVNEEVVKLMGRESAVGEWFSFMGVRGTIIGVMKNFHYQSVIQEIEPLAILAGPSRFMNFIVMRIQPGNITETMDYVKGVWESVIPNYPFESRFFDEDFERQYRAGERIGNLVRYFSILAIFIACLGLFGLASFTAEQRTKEIGIRKVLGATEPGIVFLLSVEFIKWVVAANIIAWPLAYFVMNRWLEDFAYRTDMNPLLFIFAAALSFIIALLTVSYQSIKAALTNPVKSLKYE